MHGKNEVAHVFRDADGQLLVNEIFHTIQGEGPDAGTPAVFIRLAKCNLRCFFCDTDFERGDMMSADDIMTAVTMVRPQNTRLVVITGGEPLLQNIIPLVERINKANVQVSVETAGTVTFPELYGRFAVERDPKRRQYNRMIVSPKTPNVDKLIPTMAYAWKYVIKSGETCLEDGLPICGTQVKGEARRIARPVELPHLPARVYLQPMDEGNPVDNGMNLSHAAYLCMRFGYKLSVQLHKIAGLP